MKINTVYSIIIGLSIIIMSIHSQNIEKTSNWEVIFSDDFETDFGWPNWNLLTPVGNYNWDRSTYNVYSGEYSLWCAGKDLNGCPKLNPATDLYPMPMDAYAFISNSIDLTNCTDAEIVFNVWHKTDTHDYFEVLADKANNDLKGFQFDESSNSWEEKHLSFKNWPGHGNMLGISRVNVAIRFVTDGDAATNKGVFIDNFFIRKYVAGNPDLYCSSFYFSPLNQDCGGSISINATVKNQGTASSIPTTIHYYLSTDDYIDPSTDYLMGFCNINALDTNDSIDIENLVLLPSTLAENEYFIGYVIDKDNLTDDSNVCNNNSVYSYKLIINQTFVNTIAMNPRGFDLYSNYPNPFNACTNFEIYIPENGYVTMDIFNIHGEKITTLFNSILLQGKHIFEWNGVDESSGIYLCRVSFNNELKTLKMILQR